MLLNIDKPHCTAKLHREGCVCLPNPLGTKRKPMGEMGQDGGWFEVEDEIQAQAVAKREFERGTYKRCPYC